MTKETLWCTMVSYQAKQKQTEVIKMKKTNLRLDRVVNLIPGNQFILVKDYLNGVHYADGTANEVIAKTLDYNRDLRNAEIYRVAIEGNNVICIEILKD